MFAGGIFPLLSRSVMIEVRSQFQVTGSIFAFVVRYGLAGLVYDGDRR